MKSLRERETLKKGLAGELSQYRDCDPTTVTHIRIYVHTHTYEHIHTLIYTQVNRLELL